MKSQNHTIGKCPTMHTLLICKLATKQLEIKTNKKGTKNPKTKKTIQKLKKFHKNMYKKGYMTPLTPKLTTSSLEVKEL